MDDKILLHYLSDNPDFLIRHAQALREAGVSLPEASSRPNVIDVTSKIASKARMEARQATQTTQTMLTVAAENMLHWQEFHLATLGFLACNDLTGFAQMVQEELPLIFGLASSHLVMARESAIADAESLGFVTISQDAINQLMGDEVIRLGTPADDLLPLINSKPESMAMMRLPDQLPAPIAGSLLVLGGRSEDSFAQNKGRALLLHLSEMVGVCLLSLIEAPNQNAITSKSH